MDVHLLDERETRRFWEANAASYHGSAHSGLLARLFEPWLGRRILDAGGGDGSLMRALRRVRAGSDVRAVDLAPKHADVEPGDLTALAFEPAAFDTIVCSEVIEHTSPEVTGRILAELARVVAPGGHLILTTPHDERLETGIVACPCCEVRFHRWGHQQSFREADFEQLLARHGFEPVTVFALKYGRLRRLARLGRLGLGSALGRGWLRGNKGPRTLIGVGRRAGPSS